MGAGQGVKPRVILVHGMWSSKETLKEVEDAFISQGYSTEALNLPYHCPKAEHTADSKEYLARAGLQDYQQYIVEQIKKHDEPPILVGHSMGGLLVQLVAAQVPCKGLVLLSSAPPAGINGLSYSAIRTMGRNMLRFPLWRKVTEVGLRNVRYGIANAQSSELQQEIFEKSTYESGTATIQISLGLFLRNRSVSHVNNDKIQCPILIIGGTCDRITPITVQRKIDKNFGAQSKLVEIKDCCHWTVGGKYFPQIKSEIFNWLHG